MRWGPEVNQKAKVQPPQKREDADEQLDVYSGMRVEVTTDAGEILFVAKLLGLHGDKAELHQYSESELAQDIGTIHARILRPVLQQPDLQQELIPLVVPVLRADAGPAHADIQQLTGPFPLAQAAEGKRKRS